MKKISVLMSAFAALAFSGVASARAAKLECNENKPHKGDYYERLLVTVEKDLTVTTVDEQNVKVKGNKVVGGGPGYGPVKETKEAPLKPRSKGGKAGTLTYRWNYQDEGDGDFPGPKEAHYVTLSKTLEGPANYKITYDKGDSGEDNFDMTCELAN